MRKIQQTEDELLGHLADQIRFLISSSNSYDNGFLGEAKRLAGVVRILLHDTKSSTSLLTQLGKKDIGFYDTASDYDPRNVLTHWGLLIIRLTTGIGAEYVAPLDNLPPSRVREGKASFNEWWNKIVFKDSTGNIFTRWDLIKTLANKEGGAHVDPNLNEAYVNLSKYNSLGWKSMAGRGGIKIETEMGNPVLPSMRQIAHEVIKTLRDEFPNLFPA